MLKFRYKKQLNERKNTIQWISKTVVPVNRNNSNGFACEIKRTKPVSSTKIKFNTPTKENIMTFSKFDTQVQIEETSYEPTEADLAEMEAWLDEVDELDIQAELAAL